MRYELTDHEWTAIKPMLPNKPRGVPRVNDRRVLNGIFWVPRPGAPGRDLPATLAGCIAAPELRYASSVRCLAGRAIRPGRRRLLRVRPSSRLRSWRMRPRLRPKVPAVP